MKAKVIKILIVSVLIMITSMNYQVVATNNPYLNNTEEYKTSTEGQISLAFKGKAEKVLGVVNIVGVACSVIILCIIGIRYILGSAEEKAEYKKTMLGYIIGALLLFTGSTIPNMLYRWGTSIGEPIQNSPQGPGQKPNLPNLPPVQIPLLK